MFQNAVQRRWKMYKADVKAVFLQGNSFKDPEKRYALPPKELARALGMKETTSDLWVFKGQYRD